MFQQLALTYTYNYQANTTTNTHISAGLLIGLIVITVALAVIGIIALWRIFTKAGRPGWAAIIPIYNTWVLFEISGKPGWWALAALLGFIPFVGSIIFLVLYIIAMLELAKRFGKSTVFAVFGLIIFSFIGLLILAFGDAKYSVDAPPASADPPIPPVSPTPLAPTSPQSPQAPTV